MQCGKGMIEEEDFPNLINFISKYRALGMKSQKANQ